ncbi:MAG: DUF2808 domain-containing protein [Synechococcaceae cyanobacterium]|nr:DUF2808 domain-containing protein [Synechococcaceae cyanobacterium]
MGRRALALLAPFALALSGLGLAPGSLSGAGRAGIAGAQALELGGATVFTRPPWKAELRSYNTNAGEGNVEIFLTVELSAEAGAALGQLDLQQIRGADTSFLSRLDRARAFQGRPRREGEAIPVQLDFAAQTGQVRLTFPQPVAPGTTLTVALRAWRNPWVADTYLLQVVAWPAGPNPQAAPVGVGTLRIYSPVEWF